MPEKMQDWRAGINCAIDDIRRQRHKIDNILSAIAAIEDQIKDIAMALEKEQTDEENIEAWYQREAENKAREGE
jgi:hypothetical protein